MIKNIIPASVSSAIKPRHIYLAEVGPVLLGTLGSYEFEAFAAQFVRHSQDAGFWVSFLSVERAEPKSVYARMVEEGFLSETETSDGWLYQLSSLAIEQVYLVQSRATIVELQAQLKRAQAESLLDRIKRYFRETLAPMSVNT